MRGCPELKCWAWGCGLGMSGLCGTDSLGRRWPFVGLGPVCPSPPGLGNREKDLSYAGCGQLWDLS